MSSDFPIVKWGDLVELRYGKSLKDYKDGDGNIPVYGTNGPIGFTKKALCDYPSVIVGRKGAYRGIHFSDKAFFVIDTAFYIEPKTDINLKWAYYQLLTQNINGMDSGSAIPSTSREDFYQLETVLPPIKEQERIVSILDSLNNKIELNRQINHTLEQIAQAIFKSWFVDFEPVKAKIQAEQNGLDPERAAMRAISGKTDEELDQLSKDQLQQFTTSAALFPDELEDSELGEMPKGWGVTRFKPIVEKYVDNRGKTPPTSDSGIPLLEVKHLPDNGIRPNLKTAKYITDETYDSWFRAHLKEDDIIISTVGTIGRICLIPKNEKCAIAQNLLGMRFYREKVSPYFMYYQMDGFRFRHDVDARLVITVQQSIKRKDLETIYLLLPPIEIQNAFEKNVKPLVNKQQNTESDILGLLRDLMLPRLLSGDLDMVQEGV